jgi:hypothetical protein
MKKQKGEKKMNHQSPRVVKCNTNGGSLTCPTEKKCYRTSAEAESAASELQRKDPTAVRQAAYACEECPNWHLSSMTTDAHAMVGARSYLPTNGSYAPGLGPKYQHMQSKIKELYLSKHKDHAGAYKGIIKDVCNELEIPEIHKTMIRTFLIESGIHKPNPRMSAAQKLAQNRRIIPITLESISAAKRELDAEEQRRQAEFQAQRAELERKERDWIEAHSLKISHTVEHNGVILKKEGGRLTLTYDEAFDLVEKLEAFLAALPSRAEGATA